MSHASQRRRWLSVGGVIVAASVGVIALRYRASAEGGASHAAHERALTADYSAAADRAVEDGRIQDEVHAAAAAALKSQLAALLASWRQPTPDEFMSMLGETGARLQPGTTHPALREAWLRPGAPAPWREIHADQLTCEFVRRDAQGRAYIQPVGAGVGLGITATTSRTMLQYPVPHEALRGAPLVRVSVPVVDADHQRIDVTLTFAWSERLGVWVHRAITQRAREPGVGLGVVAF